MYQVILIRTDLDMRCGKRIAQGAHASVRAAMNSYCANRHNYFLWDSDGHKKVALKIPGENELLHIFHEAEKLDLPCSLIWDIGLTQIDPSYTAAAIGPCDDEILQKLTGHLKLVS